MTQKLFPPSPYRWNFWGLVIHGILWTVAMPMIHQSAVVPVVLERYGLSPTLIGMVLSLYTIGLTVPLLPVASFVSHRPYRKRWLVRFIIAGRLTFLPAALVMLFAPEHVALVIALYAFSYGAFWFSEGMGFSPYLDLIGRVLPAHWRGRMFASMQSIGGLLAAVVAFAFVPRIMNTAGEGFTQAQGIMTATVFVVLMVGVVFLAVMKERPATVEHRRTTLGLLREMPALLRQEPVFARMTLVQLLVISYLMSYSFVMLGAEHHLGGIGGLSAVQLTGVFLVIERLGAIIAAWGWGYINDHRGGLTTMRFTGLLFLAASLFPLALELLVDRGSAAVWPFSPLYLYGMVFFLIGASMEGFWTATSIYTLDLISESRRAIYVALKQTLYLPALLWPVLGGLIVDHIGYPAVYVANAAVILAGLWVMRGLTEPRQKLSDAIEPASTEPALEAIS